MPTESQLGRKKGAKDIYLMVRFGFLFRGTLVQNVANYDWTVWPHDLSFEHLMLFSG